VATKTQYYSSFSWTSQKGLITLGSFVVVALVCEFFIVNFFAGSLLAEMSTDLLVAGVLYVVLPAVSVAVLVASWVHLTKHVILGPKTKSLQKTKVQARRSRRKTKKSSTQSVFGSIKNVFSKIGSMFSDSNSYSLAESRPTLTKASFESTITLLTIFLLTVFLLSVLLYPRLFTDFATGFYNTTSPLQGFLKGLADTLVPLASGLDSAAIGFREFFGGIASASSASLTAGDVLIGYVVVQSVAVGLSAFTAYVYVKYYCKSAYSFK
jgi:hypothetical protein